MTTPLPTPQPSLADRLKVRLAQNLTKIRKPAADETSDEAHYRRVYDDPAAWSGSTGHYG